jgi:hypothetical protein
MSDETYQLNDYWLTAHTRLWLCVLRYPIDAPVAAQHWVGADLGPGDRRSR